jgi:hypothetical protein
MPDKKGIQPTFSLARWMGILAVTCLAVSALMIAIPYGQNGWMLHGSISHGPTGTVIACEGDCSR